MNNTLAVVSLVAGIVGVVGIPASCLCACLGGPLSFLADVTAITTGIIALFQFRNNPELYKGKGMAIGGVIMGSVSLLLAVAGMIIYFVLIANNGRHMP